MDDKLDIRFAQFEKTMDDKLDTRFAQFEKTMDDKMDARFDEQLMMLILYDASCWVSVYRSRNWLNAFFCQHYIMLFFLLDKQDIVLLKEILNESLDTRFDQFEKTMDDKLDIRFADRSSDR